MASYLSSCDYDSENERIAPSVRTPLLRDDPNTNYLTGNTNNSTTQSKKLTKQRCASTSRILDNQDDNSIASSNTPNHSLQNSISRRPFHFPLDNQNAGRHKFPRFDCRNESGNGNVSDVSVVYNRYKYYTRLASQQGYENDRDLLRIPDSVIPVYFYIPRVPLSLVVPLTPEEVSSGGRAPAKRQSSFLTILAIWNTLMGSSLLVLPWALKKAGLALGLGLMIFMTLICFYTAKLIISIPKIAGIRVYEFSDTCNQLLGKWAQIISLFSSLLTLIGGCIVYWVLMTNFLFHVGTFIFQLVTNPNMTIATNMSEVICFDDTTPSQPVSAEYSPGLVSLIATGTHHFLSVEEIFATYWDMNFTVPFMLAIVLGPIITLKSVNFFLKINVIGSFCVIYLIFFSAYKSLTWGVINVSFDDETAINYTPLWDTTFPTLTGVLSLALFIHNCIISLMSTQKNPENNNRDLGIAYTLVGITYTSIALFIYLAFPIDKECLQDNFLNNLESNDIFAFMTRVFLLVQVLSLYPLLVYMLRVQVMHLLIPNEAPKYWQIAILNALLISICIAFAVYFPKIGEIIRYVGSFSGLVFIFAFPPLAYLKAKQHAGDNVSFIERYAHYAIVLLGISNFIAQFVV